MKLQSLADDKWAHVSEMKAHLALIRFSVATVTRTPGEQRRRERERDRERPRESVREREREKESVCA